MASSFTTNKRIEKPGNNDYVNTWNVPVNANFDAIDQALGGVTFLNATGAAGVVTLLDTQYRSLMLFVSGAQTGDADYRLPTGIGGIWVVRNTTTGGSHNVTISSAGGGTPAVIARNVNTLVFSDGTNIRSIAAVAGLANEVIFNSGGVLAGSGNLTFDGSTLFASSLSVTNAITAGGEIYTSSDVRIQNGSPTLKFQDTNHNSAFLHCNDNILYVLRGEVNATTWTQVNGQWPFLFNLSNNDAFCGGNFAAAGNVTAFSDARLKTDVATIKGALTKVEAMRGVTYTRTDTGARGVGVIAQEMQQIVPEVVMDGEHLSVAYGNLVGVLIESIKELSSRVKELEAR